MMKECPYTASSRDALENTPPSALEISQHWSCESDTTAGQALLYSLCLVEIQPERERDRCPYDCWQLPACLHWETWSHLRLTCCDATMWEKSFNQLWIPANSLHQCERGCYWAAVLWAVGIQAVISKSWICSAANLKLTPTARMVLTFILSRYWIRESIANSSKQWCAITNLYGLAQKCQLTTDKYRLSCPKPAQENILCLYGKYLKPHEFGFITDFFVKVTQNFPFVTI